MFMNCNSCQIELEDFLYGELDAAQQTAVQAHLSSCVECQTEVKAIEHEHQFFKTFYDQNSVEPSDEMWTAIHSRIQNEETKKSSALEKLRGLFAPFLTPANLRQIGVASLLVFVSVGLTSLYFSSRNSQETATLGPSPTPEKSVPALVLTPEPINEIAPPTGVVKIKNSPKPFVKPILKIANRPTSEDELLSMQIAKAGREYQSAIKLLNRAIARRNNEFDEPTRLQYQASLQLIDQSIASSKQALKQHPNDTSAAQFLLTAYSKKVELMQEIAMR